MNHCLALHLDYFGKITWISFRLCDLTLQDTLNNNAPIIINMIKSEKEYSCLQLYNKMKQNIYLNGNGDVLKILLHYTICAPTKQGKNADKNRKDRNTWRTEVLGKD